MSSNSFSKKFLEVLREFYVNGKQSAILFSVDVLESTFGVDEAYRIGRRIIEEGRKASNVIVAFAYESSKTRISFINMTDKVVGVFYRNGYFFIYGVYPKTPIYNIYYDSKSKYMGVNLLEIA